MHTSNFMLFPSDIQNDSLVIFICRDTNLTCLGVIPVHGHRRVSSMLKPETKKKNLRCVSLISSDPLPMSDSQRHRLNLY